MLWLNILNNETVLLIAETLFIVIGSMLLGILLSYLYGAGNKNKLEELSASLEQEKQQTLELREQVKQFNQLRAQQQSDVSDLQSKSESQSKTIYDQHQYIYAREAELKNYKSTIDELQSNIDTYQQRLRIVEEELEKTKTKEGKPKKASALPPVRANFEHVSKILGRQVTENDLTLITGIGPKTATLLHSKRIRTWGDLGSTPLATLRTILADAGGVYKSLDPSQWARQAGMAARGEWRKLRVFQEKLRAGG